jgi:hypothetical protein
MGKLTESFGRQKAEPSQTATKPTSTQSSVEVRKGVIQTKPLKRERTVGKQGYTLDYSAGHWQTIKPNIAN